MLPKKKNKKFDDLIRTATELFFRYGTKRVSIEEICKKASVSKVTLYKHFKNKNDIVIYIIQEMFAEGIYDFEAKMRENIPFVEKVKWLIHFKIEKARNYGDEFFAEIMQSDGELRSTLIQKNSEIMDLVNEFYQKGIKEEVFRRSLTPEIMMIFSDNLIQLFNSDRLKSSLPDIHKRYEAIINYYFYGIMNRIEQ